LQGEAEEEESSGQCWGVIEPDAIHCSLPPRNACGIHRARMDAQSMKAR
jgi:hypothetical protein